MSKAQDLVNKSKKTSVGIPLNFRELIQMLVEDGATEEQATKEIGLAIQKWRKNRPPTVQQKVLKAIVNNTGKPKDLDFTQD